MYSFKSFPVSFISWITYSLFFCNNKKILLSSTSNPKITLPELDSLSMRSSFITFVVPSEISYISKNVTYSFLSKHVFSPTIEFSKVLVCANSTPVVSYNSDKLFFFNSISTKEIVVLSLSPFVMYVYSFLSYLFISIGFGNI